jgi:hypothetical protein
MGRHRNRILWETLIGNPVTGSCEDYLLGSVRILTVLTNPDRILIDNRDRIL